MNKYIIIISISVILIATTVAISISRLKDNKGIDQSSSDIVNEINTDNLEDIPTLNEDDLLLEDEKGIPTSDKQTQLDIENTISDITKNINELNYTQDFEDFGSLD